jgi:xeroderma pigmentosum group C-complementing protein
VPTDLDQIEDTELTSAEVREPMPRNIQDFKDHPVYALERHLRRNEVLSPKAMPSGTVGAGSRGPLEKVYRRKDVMIARSADKWYRMGRVVKPNEIPPKWLPKKARPRGHGFDVDDEADEQDAAGTPVYTEDQTDLYEPPPVRNGRIPKNKFGNIDVYVPSMIPYGAVHVRHEYAAKAAHLLGVDYAPALTGFSFRGRHGTAVLDGIIVAHEYEESIQAVIDGLGSLEAEVLEERRRLAALQQWRRFLMALRIRERVWSGATEEEKREAELDAEMEAEMRDAPSDVTEEFDMVDDGGDDDYGDGDYGGGGFLVE